MNDRVDDSKLGPAARWAQLSARRLDWAFEAYDLFMKALSEETRNRFATGGDNGEAYVVVFGRTQVGKTTLLLDLMGVSPQEAGRVSDVLRGGRASGESATATAMEYRRSADDRWHISWDGELALDKDADMASALSALRLRMSAGKLKVDRPIVVWIPANSFSEEGRSGPRVRMLDLPGDNPKDKTEQQHVTAMAEKYVPNADLILLVGRADDLSFLNPDALTLPRIQDWRVIPERFRIVTTFSFTPHSLQHAVKAETGELDAEFFRRRLRSEIETFGSKLPEELVPSRLLYPLEFGKSWSNQAHAASNLFERVDPVVRKLKQQLHADIEEAATAYARLRSAIQVHITADEIKSIRLKEWDDEIAHICGKISQIDAERAHGEKRLNDCEIAQQKIEDVDEQTIFAELEARVTAFRTDALESPETVDPRRDAIALRISHFSRRLQDRATQFEPALEGKVSERFWQAFRPDEEIDSSRYREAIHAEFASLRSRLDGYSLDRYLPWMPGSNFDEDKTLLRDSMNRAVLAVSQHIGQHWKKVADKRIAALRNAQRLATEKVEMAQRDLEEIGRRASRLASSMQHEQARRQAFSDQMDRDREMGECFKAYLNEAYLHAVRDRRQSARAQGASTGALLHLLSAAQLRFERSKILYLDQT
jgi:energy-coupling factor transporter ATP-binding protein EcfA2